MSVYFKIKFNYTTYQISEQYLRREQDLVTAPTNVQLFGFGITLLSAKCAITSLMLLPSVLCLKYGLHSFALSGERKQLMLMIGASLCLLSGGIIFAAVIAAHFYCAEYLFFSGNSTSAFSALENSWLIMCGCCGDCMTLELFLGFRGIFISSLSRLNLSKKLTQAFLDNRYADDLYFELRRVSLKDDIFVILEGLI